MRMSSPQEVPFHSWIIAQCNIVIFLIIKTSMSSHCSYLNMLHKKWVFGHITVVNKIEIIELNIQTGNNQSGDCFI